MTQFGSRTRWNPRFHFVVLGCFALLSWTPVSANPVLSIAVDGAPAESLDTFQVCDGGTPETCFGFGDSVGDLFVSSFEISADTSAFTAGSIDFYNTSLTNTLSVDATILFPMVASIPAAELTLGTGVVTSVIGGGMLNINATAFIDDPLTAVLSIDEISPGVAFSVCDDLLTDPSCQDSVLSLTTTGAWICRYSFGDRITSEL